jgi:hypothetical protein
MTPAPLPRENLATEESDTLTLLVRSGSQRLEKAGSTSTSGRWPRSLLRKDDLVTEAERFLAGVVTERSGKEMLTRDVTNATLACGSFKIVSSGNRS